MESKLDLDASLGLTGTRRCSSPWSEEVAAGILAITDFFAVLAAGILANAVVYADSARLFDHAAGTLLCGVAVVHSKSLFRLYDSVQTKRLLPLLDRLLVSLIVAYWAVVLVAHISDVPASSYPPRWKLALFVFSLVMVLLGQVAFIAGVATLSKRGLLSRNVAIVGATEYTTMLIDQVERRFGPSTHILGVFDEEASGDRPLGQPEDGSAVHGTTEDLVSLAQKVRVDEIFVALPASAQTRVDSIVSKIQVIRVQILNCITQPRVADERVAIWRREFVQGSASQRA